MYSDFIRSSLDSFHEYLANNLHACKDHRAARVSPFWAEHFSDRRNFPDTQEFLAFRRGDFLYGIGDTKPSDPVQKQREFAEVCKSIQFFTPRPFLEKLHEPFLGAPLVFPLGKATLSTSYVLNAGTTWRIKELVNQHGPKNRPLHIAEIGAGWGACASQLHQVCDVASYTVIDLPENLCLSSTYLAATVPGRKSRFIDCNEGISCEPKHSTLNFGLPAAIDNLSGPYDVIFNTVSFQEMDRETVDAYFSWATRTLARDGLLISFNSHDKAGIRRPSEYLHDGLALIHMAPFRKVPAGYFNTIPYEMVFRPSGAGNPNTLAPAVDALGELMQLGLDGQLTPLVEATLTGRDPQTVAGLLSKLQAFFYAASEERRQILLEQLLREHPGALTNYLAGSYRFAFGNFPAAHTCLESSMAQGLEGFAALRARVLLAAIERASGETKRPIQEILAALEADAGGLLLEIQGVLERHDVSALQAHVARVLDCTLKPRRTVRALLGKVRRRLLGVK